jgi:hypothetical protein
MTDWTPEEDEAFNEVEKQSNLGKRILKEIRPERTWIGLTDEDISEIVRGTHNTGSFVRAIEAKLKQKNEQQTQ